MFAYLLIAFELLMLSFVFWFIFIREPKPYKLEESLWGRYGESTSAFTGPYLDSGALSNPASLPAFASNHNNTLLSEMPRKLAKRPRNHYEAVNPRDTRHGAHEQATDTPGSDLKYGWVYNNQARRPGFLSGILAAIGQ
ncbi:MAG: hypothetical protein K8F91_10615, partial [Candidatus Obscuribacterales bacterium]|nr:hypothetical protein [Candidatus Obscuribacterales bacterium]